MRHDTDQLLPTPTPALFKRFLHGRKPGYRIGATLCLIAAAACGGKVFSANSDNKFILGMLAGLFLGMSIGSETIGWQTQYNLADEQQKLIENWDSQIGSSPDETDALHLAAIKRTIINSCPCSKANKYVTALMFSSLIGILISVTIYPAVESLDNLLKPLFGFLSGLSAGVFPGGMAGYTIERFLIRKKMLPYLVNEAAMRAINSDAVDSYHILIEKNNETRSSPLKSCLAVSCLTR